LHGTPIYFKNYHGITILTASLMFVKVFFVCFVLSTIIVFLIFKLAIA